MADSLNKEGWTVMDHPNNWGIRGVYTLDQAARMLGIKSRMVKRWIYGTGRRDAAIIPEYSRHAGELITFLDFIQSLAIRDIRRQRRVSLQKIRKTVLKARELGIDFPFARRHTAYVFRNDVVLRLGEGQLITVTGKYTNQHLINPIVYSYLDDLGFDVSGLANRYVPFSDGFRSVELDPMVNFGAPTVLPRRYTVRTLVDAYYAENNSIDAAADVCDVSPKDIEIALKYESSLAA